MILTRPAGKPLRSNRRNASRVSVCNQPLPEHSHNRRTAIKVIAGRAAALPAASLLSASAAMTSQTARATMPSAGKAGRVSPIVRDFADPLIELVRLLREASEVEHALMLQYLYAAASLKPAYARIAGDGTPNATDLLGVAIQEMQHLGVVNRLLRTLGAAPNLLRQDFPFEPDIYPFAFNLEPLSRTSLAKYVYAEAPAGALASPAPTPRDARLSEELEKILGSHPRANHIGSLYDAILATAHELNHAQNPGQTDLTPWFDVLEKVKQEGEEDHFNFFRSLFLETHEAFGGRTGLWDLAPEHPDYPARQVPINPSAYVGHVNQIVDTDLHGLAWLSNLHYWSILLLLNLGYRGSDEIYMTLSKMHMVGPLWALLKDLPEHGCGVPFDPLSMGYAPGHDEQENVRFLRHMLAETHRLEGLLLDRLPEEYPLAIAQESLSELASKES